MGLELSILSGDSTNVAKSVGQRLGINSVYAPLLPEQKLKTLKELGVGTAFVGDGVNDALCLISASMGIALSDASEISRQAGDVILLKNDVLGVVKAIALARAGLGVIRQNLFWAFGYNALCIPVAAGVFAGAGVLLNPAYAALAMGFSSLSVVLNSLRIKRIKIDL